MEKLQRLKELLLLLAEREALRKLVLSSPVCKDGSRVDARLCEHKGAFILAVERKEKDGRVLHRNISLDRLSSELDALLPSYMRINLLSPLGDVEYKRNTKGSEVLLGAETVFQKLRTPAPAWWEGTAETLDRKKQYILAGNEPFLVALGISDAGGRVHDKKQPKFRQINRFLEHVRDVERYLPKEGTLLIYDLCCGKSYLSFAVYHYFTVVRGRTVEMLGMDLKRDCMEFCEDVARRLSFDGMHFVTGDVRRVPRERVPHLVLSLHACDTATDIVLHFAADVRADVILSTPCCQHDLLRKMKLPALSFVTDHPKLSGKLAETLTDGLRLARLRAHGYDTAALELTDPDDTPKNTLLRAVRIADFDAASSRAERARNEYREALRSVLGDGVQDYPENIL